MVTAGSITAGAAQLLRRMVHGRLAFLISGGTGSGKTTLLSALLGVVPSTERLLIIEDSRELAPVHPHLVRLEARQGNAESAGAVSLTNLVRQALRMRPDRLVGIRDSDGEMPHPGSGADRGRKLIMEGWI